jgi:hypothetical protein
MFSFGKDHKRIRVAFHEAEAPQPFAQSDVPIEQLPYTFKIQTTLDLGEQKWLIASATPPTKAEFRKSGKVTLRLRRQTVGFVNPSELLYSLATISNDLPALVPAHSLENVLVVHEDDWRQIEFVSRTQEPQVFEELASIRHVFETQRVGPGFKTTHVRKLIPAPFFGEAHHLTDIKRNCHITREYAGVAFSNTAAIVRGGFAFSTSNGFALWGQAADDGVLIALCIQPDEATKELPSSGLTGLSQGLNMLLVDWPRAQAL